nr:unnamed protein product [Digitaria exilis]
MVTDIHTSAFWWRRLHGALKVSLVELALLGALGVELGVRGGHGLLVLDAAAESGGVHGGFGLGGGMDQSRAKLVDPALGCAEVLLEGEDVVLEAVALFLGGEELEAEGSVGDGEAQGAVDGVAHVLLGGAGERGSPSIIHLAAAAAEQWALPVTAAIRSDLPPSPSSRKRKDGD